MLLRKLIIIMIIVGVIPLAISGYFLININQDALKSAIQEKHLQQVKTLTSEVGNYTDSIKYNIFILCQTQNIPQLSETQRHELLKVMLERYTELNILTLFDDATHCEQIRPGFWKLLLCSIEQPSQQVTTTGGS